MKIKNYKEFVKEGVDHKNEYGCVMLGLECPNWEEIQSEINPDDVYHHPTDPSYGLENNPHVTLKFGLHPEVEDSKIEEIINKFKGQNLLLDRKISTKKNIPKIYLTYLLYNLIDGMSLSMIDGYFGSSGSKFRIKYEYDSKTLLDIGNRILYE